MAKRRTHQPQIRLLNRSTSADGWFVDPSENVVHVVREIATGRLDCMCGGHHRIATAARRVKP